MADAVEAGLRHCGSGRSSSPSPAASPEFEFWMAGKNPPSFPSPAGLLTADELFAGGRVLPLHTMQQPTPTDAEGDDDEDANTEEDAAQPELPTEAGEEAAAAQQQQQPLAESCEAPTPDLPAVTFKWKDIFKAGGAGTGEARDRKKAGGAGAGGEARDRKKAERRVSSASGNAELININIWPFSRSRSAGHAAAAAGPLGKAKPTPGPSPSVATNAGSAAATAPAAAVPAPAPRKVSSAPCSRSNSRGESAGPAVPVVSAANPAGPAVLVVPVADPTAAPAVADADAVATEPAEAVATAPATTASMLRRLVPGGQGRSNAGVAVTANGIRVGRPSPVWQLRRNKLQQAEQKQAAAAKKKAAMPISVVATDDKDTATAATAPGVSAAPAVAGCRTNAEGEEVINPPQGLFGLRTFFSKKVY